MTDEKEKTTTHKGVSRRQFIAGTVGGLVVGAAAGAVTGSLGFPTVPTSVSEPWLPAKWDYTADVVVVGMGFAGICAAIEANAAGANVLVLEKSPIADGGNSGCCVGAAHTQIRADSVADFISDIQQGIPATDNDQALITATATDMQDTPTWLSNLGMSWVWSRVAAGRDSLTGAMRPAGYSGQIALPNGTAGNGKDFFAFLHNYAVSKNIPIMLSTPATDLIQNPVTKEVLGVKALTEVTATPGTGLGYSGGTQINVRAAKGVVLSCGGFESNPQLESWLIYPAIQIYPEGTPYNTGDGIRMSAAAGADQWHENDFEWDNFQFKLPSDSVHCGVGRDLISSIGGFPATALYVNKSGKRFMDEVNDKVHWKGPQPVVDYDPLTGTYPNIPFYMVFDDTLMKAGPLAPTTVSMGTFSYNNVHGLYTWSNDNSAELAKGWILQGTTLSQLATNAGIDPSGLAATISAYNNYAATGADPDFGRPATQMKPIATPPYYAIEMCFAMISTNGGPVRNAKYQTVDIHGNPIPRLYSAGELGSINSLGYVAGNVSEALTTGRVAGKNAAAETPWT